MGIFTLKKEIDIDLKQFSLTDILNHLENENFFYDSPSFHLQDKVNENHLVFRTPKNKAAPREIYSFEYFPNEKKIKVNGKYENMFFPCLITYVFPFAGIYFHFTNESYTDEQFKILMWLFFGVTIYCAAIILSGLSASKNIERELKIRLNYLLRKR